MSDQATHLRNLVLRSMRQNAAGRGPVPRLILVAGGKPGVGTTTVSVNLSISLAQLAVRVVLVDADPDRPRVADFCGLEKLSGIADVLAARRDIHEVLQLGPAGIQIAPGADTSVRAAICSEQAQHRLIKQLQALGRYAEVVLVDIGNGSAEDVNVYCRAADDILLITSPDQVAVMDCYAAIKSLASTGVTAPIRVIVNQAGTPQQAADVCRRIQMSCQRFLQREVLALGHISPDPCVPAAASTPFVLRAPASPASQAVARIAAALSGNETLSRPSSAVA